MSCSATAPQPTTITAETVRESKKSRRDEQVFAVPWRYLDAETAVSLLKRAVYTIKRKVDSVKSLCEEHHFDDAETREAMA